ncbi:MAG TPA: hypothetical protein VIL34_00695 [Actinopolymorphaceae bacterium]|jgi:hypothetical protein
MISTTGSVEWVCATMNIGAKTTPGLLPDDVISPPDSNGSSDSASPIRHRSPISGLRRALAGKDEPGLTRTSEQWKI